MSSDGELPGMVSPRRAGGLVHRGGSSSSSSLFTSRSVSSFEDLDSFSSEAGDMDKEKSPRDAAPAAGAESAPKGSPTFLRHQSLLNSNPSAPPPISNFESFKLRSRLLKAHISASAAEECVSELARFGTSKMKVFY